jgi:peptide/nickel transport system substrate-binding protein
VSLGKERADDLLADTEFFVRAALCKILMDAGHLRTFSGTAEDVRFSFERYRGAANKTLKERVSAVETPDASRVRIRSTRARPGLAGSCPRSISTRWATTGVELMLEAQEVQRTRGLTLSPTVVQATFWVYFADQWDPKSPCHDRRVRLAANHTSDRHAINKAERSRITGSIIPATFDFYWGPPVYPYDPARAKELLAEAGYPNGFDAGEYFCDAAFSSLAESVITYLKAVGIQAKLRPLERAAFFKGYSEKKLKNLIQGASGAFGNASTRIEAFVASGGAYVYGSYDDIDGLFREQAAEMDTKRRGATLWHLQQLIHEKAMFAPIWEIGGLSGVGPRVEDSGRGHIAGYPFSAPYEDVKLKAK